MVFITEKVKSVCQRLTSRFQVLLFCLVSFKLLIENKCPENNALKIMPCSSLFVVCTIPSRLNTTQKLVLLPRTIYFLLPV